MNCIILPKYDAIFEKTLDTSSYLLKNVYFCKNTEYILYSGDQETN